MTTFDYTDIVVLDWKHIGKVRYLVTENDDYECILINLEDAKEQAFAQIYSLEDTIKYANYHHLIKSIKVYSKDKCKLEIVKRSN